MDVSEAPRSPVCGRGVVETEAALAPRSLQNYIWARRSRWLQTDGQQEETERHCRAGLRAGAELWSSNFGGTRGSEAVLKGGVLGRE